MADELTTFADFAETLAEAARTVTMPRWRNAGEARNKADDGRFDPVTEADVAAEEAIRALIEVEYPDHGITGEEGDDRPGSGPWRWSLDPIDGTRSFVCGLPTWGTLIALLRDDQPVLGLIDIPRLGERYIGFDGSSRLSDHAGTHVLKTSGCTTLAEARFSSTDPYLFGGIEYEAFVQLRRSARTTRYGLDSYGYARLAAGSLDLVVESGLKAHDYDALVPVIRGAGGSVGNWRGGADLGRGQIIAAATPQLFEEAVRILEAAAL